MTPLPAATLGKIGILKNTEHKKVDWDALSYATEKETGNFSIWATCLAEKELPTEQLMHIRGSCTTPTCPRKCGHAKEQTPNIFKCKKRDHTWENLKKKLVRWGIKNRAEPTLIPVLIHGISLWRKWNLPLTPLNIPIQVESEFNRQNSIGWIQALTGLLSYELAEKKNAYLKSTREKVTG